MDHVDSPQQCRPTMFLFDCAERRATGNVIVRTPPRDSHGTGTTVSAPRNTSHPRNSRMDARLYLDFVPGLPQACHGCEMDLELLWTDMKSSWCFGLSALLDQIHWPLLDLDYCHLLHTTEYFVFPLPSTKSTWTRHAATHLVDDTDNTGSSEASNWLPGILTWRFPLSRILLLLFRFAVRVLVLTLVSSDSFFDSPPEPAFYISNITEWRKEIPAPIVSAPDFPFSSDFQDMHTSDFFELKDTVSECSMDSAYQSQSGASRRGPRKPEMTRQDSRSQMSSHFVGSDIYSPTMSSDNFSAFPDTLDMSHMQPATTGSWEPTDGPLSYANYSTAQDYTHYPTSNMTRFTPSTISDSPHWPTADAHFQTSSFPFTWPTQTNDAMFSTPASQRNWQTASLDASDRPATLRHSSYTLQEESRRTSAQDASFGAFVGTPTSTTSVHFPQVELKDDTKPASVPQSLDGHDDTLSQSEAAETKLEEERTKVARSHPLYQQTPDKDGKYHCPEEGKTGCSHKPTALKCNYDKYVDSHLKPFRCNKKTCVGVQFSSTACLLRHEREAHGMHGHGARPHLCHFRECERAVPGHGFPRRYNLFDHMKRVHQYDGPTTEPSPPVQGQAPRKSASRKRKVSAEEAVEKRVKVVKLTAEQQRQQRGDALAKEFLTKKQHLIEVLMNLSNPSDLGDDIQLTKEVVGLHDICTQYRDVFGG